jgi:hypothetical protein
MSGKEGEKCELGEKVNEKQQEKLERHEQRRKVKESKQGEVKEK